VLVWSKLVQRRIYLNNINNLLFTFRDFLIQGVYCKVYTYCECTCLSLKSWLETLILRFYHLTSFNFTRSGNPGLYTRGSHVLFRQRKQHATALCCQQWRSKGKLMITSRGFDPSHMLPLFRWARPYTLIA